MLHGEGPRKNGVRARRLSALGQRSSRGFIASSVLALVSSGCLGDTKVIEQEGAQRSQIPSAAHLNDATPDCAGVAPDVAPPSVFEVADGWASVAADGLEGTTGGAGGRVVLARTLEELETFGESAEPLVIQVCGSMGTQMERIDIGSNKTLVGVGIRPTIKASIDIDRAQNVVIRDVFIEGSIATDGGDGPDALGIRRSHHVWIDHVDISDGSDGNLDVTNESNYVTVSWSRFWYRDPNRAHRFSTLIGSSDSATADAGLLKVTMHHNWWADNVVERMPRARFGDVHVFNNYYSSSNNNYCIRVGFEAHLLVEGNFFHGVSNPVDLDPSGQVVQHDNVFESVRGQRAEFGEAFTPGYAYAMDPAEAVRDMVPAEAGPRG